MNGGMPNQLHLNYGCVPCDLSMGMAPLVPSVVATPVLHSHPLVDSPLCSTYISAWSIFNSLPSDVVLVF
jgi:hypothetical protein